MPQKDAIPHQHLPASKSAHEPSPPLTEQELLQRQVANALQRVQAKSLAAVRPQDVMVLQRTLGNRAVQRLLAPAPAATTPVIQRGKTPGDEGKKKKKKVLTQPEGQVEKPHAKKEQKQKEEKEEKQTDAMVAHAKASEQQATPKSNDGVARLERSRARNKDRKATPKKERALRKVQTQHIYGYDNPQINTGFLKGNFSVGHGGQPSFKMNKDDYGGAVVGTDYDAVIKVIHAERKYHSEPEIAADMLAYIEQGTFDQSKYSPEMCRAAATFISLTQLIEAHDTREQSADKWARSCLRAIIAGETTFHAEFNRRTGNFLPARAKAAGAKAGGQEATRLALGRDPLPSDKATKEQVLHDGWDASLAHLSESSEEEGMEEDELKESKSNEDKAEVQAIETEVPTGVSNVNNAWNNAGGDFEGDDF